MHGWPSFLINLVENESRLASSVAQFEALGIPFERFDAVNGWALSENEISDAYDSKANHRNARDPMLLPEIGCYLSHVMVWKRIAEGDADGGMVFEDDFHAGDDLPKVLKLLPAYSEDFDMVKLFSHVPIRSHIDQRPLGPRHQIVTPYRIPNCTVAYSLTRNAARRLTMHAVPFFRAVDEDLKWFWEKNMNIGAVLPLPVSIGNQGTVGNTISGERFAIKKKRGKLRSRIARSFRIFSYATRYESLLHFHRIKQWMER